MRPLTSLLLPHTWKKGIMSVKLAGSEQIQINPHHDGCVTNLSDITATRRLTWSQQNISSNSSSANKEICCISLLNYQKHVENRPHEDENKVGCMGCHIVDVILITKHGKIRKKIYFQHKKCAHCRYCKNKKPVQETANMFA